MLTHINSPVNIYHVLVCQPLSPPLITSISPPPPAPPTEPPRRFGLTMTVIGGEAGRNGVKMQVEEGRMEGERESDEKRRGEGNYSSETRGCGMAYYRSNV